MCRVSIRDWQDHDYDTWQVVPSLAAEATAEAPDMLDLLTGGVLDDAHLANYQPLELLLLKVGHY